MYELSRVLFIFIYIDIFFGILHLWNYSSNLFLCPISLATDEIPQSHTRTYIHTDTNTVLYNRVMTYILIY